MKFTDAIWINAPSRKVWEYVGSLDIWPQFYAKAATGTCRQLSREGGVVGSRYAFEFRGGSSATLFHGEIVDVRPGSIIAVELTLDAEQEPMTRGWVCQVRYELTDEGDRTKVTERVDTGHGFDSDINWLVELVGGVMAWLIYRARKLAGKTNLQRLKGIVEGARF